MARMFRSAAPISRIRAGVSISASGTPRFHSCIALVPVELVAPRAHGSAYHRVMRAIKLFMLLATALAASACSSEESPFYAYEDPSDAPPPIRAAAEAVVRISTPWSSATGSFISADGVLLTNNHVLGVEVCPREGCFAKLTLSYERGHPFKAPVQVFVQPLHVDVGLDMAVVQVFSV